MKRKKASSVKKNFIYQMLYEILVLILPFITSPYIARVIGAEGLGTYSYSYAVAYYFALFSLLGIKNYGNRIIAQVRDNPQKLNEVFSNLTAVHILISLLFSLIYVVYIFYLRDEKIYAAIQMLYVLSALFDISWFYFGIEKFKLTVMRNTLVKIFNVICVFVFVRTASDLWKYCVIMAVGALISQITLWVPLKKYIRLKKPEWKKMTVHIKPLLILFLPAIAVSLYKYMDKIMIGLMSNKEQLGLYENAEKVINIPMTVISSFGVVMLPKMSNLAVTENKTSAQKYISSSMKYVMCLALGLAFGLAGVGSEFAPLFWGEEFFLSGTIIMGLSITIPFAAFANVIRTQYLIPNEKDKEYLFSVMAGAVVNLIINAFLISKIGAFGAAVGTIAAEVTVCWIQSFAVRNELSLKKYILNFRVFLLLGFVMSFGLYTFNNKFDLSWGILIIKIVFGGAFYLAGSMLYFYITKDEVFIKTSKGMLEKVKKLLKKRGGLSN